MSQEPNNSSDTPTGAENQETSDKRSFSQEELERIISSRLERAQSKAKVDTNEVVDSFLASQGLVREDLEKINKNAYESEITKLRSELESTRVVAEQTAKEKDNFMKVANEAKLSSFLFNEAVTAGCEPKQAEIVAKLLREQFEVIDGKINYSENSSVKPDKVIQEFLENHKYFVSKKESGLGGNFRQSRTKQETRDVDRRMHLDREYRLEEMSKIAKAAKG